MAMNILLSFLMHRAVFAPKAGVLDSRPLAFFAGGLDIDF
jgi:hypothetical protein